MSTSEEYRLHRILLRGGKRGRITKILYYKKRFDDDYNAYLGLRKEARRFQYQWLDLVIWKIYQGKRLVGTWTISNGYL